MSALLGGGGGSGGDSFRDKIQILPEIKAIVILCKLVTSIEL